MNKLTYLNFYMSAKQQTTMDLPKLQSLYWPLEAGSKKESSLKCQNFKAEIRMFTACLMIRFWFYIRCDIKSANLCLFGCNYLVKTVFNHLPGPCLFSEIRAFSF